MSKSHEGPTHALHAGRPLFSSMYTMSIPRKQALCSRRSIQKPQDHLVHAEHDRRAGHRTEQMRSQTAVHGRHALLLEDELEALDQACVLWLSTRDSWCLAETRADDLGVYVSQSRFYY